MATRTTIKLEDDLLRSVREEALRRNATFRETLNDLLRLGLEKSKQAKDQPFRIKTFRGNLRPGLSYDSTSKLIEDLEGPWHK